MTLKPLLILPPLALGVLGFLWMTQPVDTAQEPSPPAPLAVRVMTVSADPLTVTATGYGRVEAVQSWSAISQVEGRITALFEDLAVGVVVEQGAVVARVDPTDYELAIRKSRANLAAAEASLAELARSEDNSRRLLEVEQRILDVSRTEYDRVADLVGRGTSTQASLDTSQRALLAQETSVTNLTNTLALFPAQRASAEATLAVRQAELAEAERDLANATLTAPFRGRVSEVMVETGQFIRTGESLMTIEAADAVEVVADIQPRAFTPLISTVLGERFASLGSVDVSRVADYLNDANVTATVVMRLSGLEARYPASIVRFRGAIDAATGAIGLAVRVDDPLLVRAEEGRPPLNVGSFVSVEFTSPPVDGVLAIPRAALRLGDDGAPFVYTVGAGDVLAVTPVTPGPVVGDRVIITGGLSAGDRLILSAPRPPIPGLPLTPVETQ